MMDVKAFMMGELGDTAGSIKSQGSGPQASSRGQKEKQAMPVRSIIAQVPIHGQRVLDTRDDMHGFADHLDKGVDALLLEHANDFYLAFRAHQYIVQKEIYDLRNMAEAQERKTANDSRIRNLEAELEWFMSEALRLDQLAKASNKEVESWRAKAQALEQSKKSNSDVVKGHKRLNKVYNLATDQPSPGADGSLSARASPKWPKAKKELSLQERMDLEHRLSIEAQKLRGSEVKLPKVTEAQSPSKQQMQIFSPKSARSVSSAAPSPQASPGRPSPGMKSGGSAVPSPQTSPGIKSGAMSARSAGSSPPLANEREQWYVDTIRELQEKLQKQKRETRLLKTARAGTFTKKHALEEFFLKCVSEARKDLERGQRLFHERDRGRDDREKVMETLLGSENAMVFIFEKIFPHRVGMTRNLMEGDRHLGLVSSEIMSGAKQTYPPLE